MRCLFSKLLTPDIPQSTGNHTPTRVWQVRVISPQVCHKSRGAACREAAVADWNNIRLLVLWLLGLTLHDCGPVPFRQFRVPVPGASQGRECRMSMTELHRQGWSLSSPRHLSRTDPRANPLSEAYRLRSILLTESMLCSVSAVSQHRHWRNVHDAPLLQSSDRQDMGASPYYSLAESCLRITWLPGHLILRWVA
ncbi:hypothetical protein BC834DRAFT_109606 [Gloeopeniophorella convolvens]|nr:hypothetical protein BC834DRAFT_109606 [Gloeopeniophorella convolvens]